MFQESRNIYKEIPSPLLLLSFYFSTWYKYRRHSQHQIASLCLPNSYLTKKLLSFLFHSLQVAWRHCYAFNKHIKLYNMLSWAVMLNLIILVSCVRFYYHYYKSYSETYKSKIKERLKVKGSNQTWLLQQISGFWILNLEVKYILAFWIYAKKQVLLISVCNCLKFSKFKVV